MPLDIPCRRGLAIGWRLDRVMIIVFLGGYNMETSIQNGCYYQGKLYADGSKVRGYMRSWRCRNREWIDLDEGASDSKPSLAYIYH